MGPHWGLKFRAQNPPKNEYWPQNLCQTMDNYNYATILIFQIGEPYLKVGTTFIGIRFDKKFRGVWPRGAIDPLTRINLNMSGRNALRHVVTDSS